MKQKKFPIIYFLLYPFLGPLLGFIAVMTSNIAINQYLGNLTIDLSFASSMWGDLFSFLPVAYVFGILPATVTGIDAAKSLRKNGKSSLVKTLLSAFVINIIILFAGVVAFGFEFLQFGVVMIPASLFAVLVLKGIEKLFFLKS